MKGTQKINKAQQSEQQEKSLHLTDRKNSNKNLNAMLDCVKKESEPRVAYVSSLTSYHHFLDRNQN